MIKKISDFIVSKRNAILAVMLILAVASVFCTQFVEINEDMTKYLPDDSNMKAGIDIMAEEFPEIETFNSIRVMFDDLTDAQKVTVQEELSAIDGVHHVDYDANSSEYNQDHHTLYKLNISCDYGSSQEKAIYSALKSQFANYSVVWKNDDTSIPDIPLTVIVTAMVILMAVLFVMCGSWIEPFLFLIVIGVAVIMNGGTNLLLGSVANITNSISAILQLVLSMDYSIILMNRYRQEKALEPDSKQAMNNALASAFSSVASSSFTTVIGLLMLVFMRFKIGANLGIVLAKGVFISMICVLTMLPAIILACDRLIQKTEKKSLSIPMNWAARFSYSMRYVVAGLFVVLFVGSLVLQQHTNIAYTLTDTDEIADIFSKSNTLVMVYENQDEEQIDHLIARLEENENVKSIMGYGTILGKPYTSDELAEALGNISEDISLNSGVIDMLYYNYYTGGKTGAMTASKLLAFISDTVESDQTFSAYIDDDIKDKVALLKRFADAEALTAPMTASELADIFSIDADMAELLFVYYYASLDSYDPGAMTLAEFVSFLQNDIANDPVFSSYLDTSAMERVGTLVSLTDPAEIQTSKTSAELASTLGIDETLVKTIFTFHNLQIAADQNDVSSTTMSMVEFVDSILTNPLIKALMGNERLAQLQMMQQIINATINDQTFDCLELSDLLGMDGRMLKMLYTFKASATEKGHWALSVEDFIAFILDDVLSDEMFADRIDAETADMLSSARTLVSAVTSGKAYSASGMGTLLSGLSEKIDDTMIELMYLYAESAQNSDPAWTMTLETLLGYVKEDVLNDPRFASVMDDAMRQKLLEAQDSLDEGKKQLVTEKHARLIITSSYPDEGAETTAFLADLEQFGNDNLAGEYYMVGNAAMNYEMQKTFDRELLAITLLTAAAIFLIVALTFRSISIPLILVLLVQSGVYITIAITGVLNGGIYYLALLIVECILMGATIDYGILLTNYYCEARKTANIQDALRKAYAGSIHTIMTSGLILILVTAVVGGLFENPTITAIVKTISMGTLCATLLILFVLPGVLAACDKLVTKKRYRIEDLHSSKR